MDGRKTEHGPSQRHYKMGKDAKEEVVTESQGTSRIDPASQAYLDQVREQAQAGSQAILDSGPLTAGIDNPEFTAGVDALKALVDPATFEAMMDKVGSAGGSGVNFEFENLDLGRIQEFLNPYLEEVVGGVQRDTDIQREAVRSRAASAATAAKAFGGNRAALLETQGLEDVNRNELRQLGQLRFQGYESARGAAMQEHLTGQGLGLQAAMGTAANKTNAAIASLQSRTQLGLGGLQAGGQAAQGLVGAGMTRQQVETEQARDEIRRQAAALGLNISGMGPTGTDVAGSGTQTTTSSPGFDPFSFGLGLLEIGAGVATGGIA